MTESSGRMTRVRAVHQHWKGFLLLSDTDGTVVHEGIGSTGRYERQDGGLNITWDMYGREQFIALNDCFIQEELAKNLIPLDRLNLLACGQTILVATKVTLLPPGCPYEVTLRVGSSDIPTFQQVFINREYDSENLPGTAKRIVDLGANIGLSAVFFAVRYPQAEILAVEPEPANFALLRANVAALGGRVRCINAAVWKEDGTINLHTVDEAGKPLGEWGVQVSEASLSSRSKTSCFRLETLLRAAGFEAVDILKVDIEGAELELFSHGVADWLDKVEMVIAETHDRFRPGSEAALRAALAGAFEELPRNGENLFFRRRKV